MPYVLSGMVVSTVIITKFSLFKHWLDTTSHNVNPVKLIVNVLNYTRKTSIVESIVTSPIERIIILPSG